jgi:DNA-binding response OmpR family regulator
VGTVTIQAVEAVDVATLSWPDEESVRQRLARDEVPRLLLIAAGIEPPVCADCFEDWIRIPAGDADLHARLGTLASRRSAHKSLRIDGYGVVRQGSAVTILAPAEHALAESLIEDFGNVVPTASLERKINNESHDPVLSLRVHVSRLRKQLAAFGVSVSCVRNVGYVMHRN